MSGDALIWAVIVALGLVTYVTRFSFIGLIGDRRLPPLLVEALGFVPVTVIPALIAPALLAGAGEGLASHAPQLAAAAATVAVGIAVRQLLPALTAGIAVWAGLAWLI